MLFSNNYKSIQKPDNEFKRLQVNYKNKSDKFFCKSRDFSKQFAHIYAARLTQMKIILPPKIKEKWGSKYPIKKLFELSEDDPEKCIIIGTLFKHQQLKPSILKELSEENQLAPQPVASNFVDESDKLILEDELQRIRLLGKLDVHSVVTGIVCAVLGYVKCDGRFEVEDYLFFESGPQKSLPIINESPLIVFISGLDWSRECEFSTSLELFQQWIFGNLDGIDGSKDWEAASIVRVIIAGNSINSSEKIRTKSLSSNESNNDHEIILEAVQKLDNFIQELSKSVHVDLMPGEFDPTNYMLPQQPLHHCMFAKSAHLKTFQSVTNPYACEIEGRSIVGTSGQNVTDILRYSKIDDTLDALRSTLEWSHIVPTGPDTLPCYPYYENDPFVLSECPHIYFAGNCNEFKTDLYCGKAGQKTRLICVPSFMKNQSVTVVNINSLETHQLFFKMDSFDDDVDI